MAYTAKDIQKLIDERNELQDDLEQSFEVIVGLLDVFGIQVDKIKEIKITSIAKSMKDLAFDAMIPGSSKRLQEKFSFLLEAEDLAKKYEGDLIEIQKSMRERKK